MEEFKESFGIERKIILCLRGKVKPISQISKELGKPIQTISITIKRMIDQGIVDKSTDYIGDSRKREISLNDKKIKIKKTHDFYSKYFLISIGSLVFSVFLSFLFKSSELFMGSVIAITPPILYMLFNAYIIEDKVVVEKSVKKEDSNKKIEQVDTVDEQSKI